MPKQQPLLDWVKGNLALVGFLISVFMGIIQGVRMWDAHLVEDARRDERLHVLEQITVQEHPAYSPTIYWYVH